jgi:hypothetical protein
MYDEHGEITEDKEHMFGRPTKYKMLHPENLVFVDETGCNTNQKDDGHIGGEMFALSREGDDLGVVGVTTDIPFTVLCFTSCIGEPIHCGVILKSSKDIKDIPISWKLGIDIRKDIETGRTTYETFELNYGLDFSEDISIVGGPKCIYNGKVLPYFRSVGCSTNASITSEILAGMIASIDKQNVFDRSTWKLPVLLLDGHQSRMKLPFLEYVNNPEHKWMVCLGVPYGTHLWQVADAPELNGCFKINLWKAKRAYLKYRALDDQRFVMTDIIPLINMAWQGLFTRADRARKAILQRGWGPMNYCLLDHLKLIKLEPIPEMTENIASVISPDPSITTITINGSTGSTDSSLLRLEVNAEGPLATGMLDITLDKRQMGIGRTKAFLDEKKKPMDQKNEQLDVLAGITSVTNGQLASNNVRVQEEDKKQKQDVIAVKKDTQQNKSSQQFQQAYQKYVNSERLTASDLRALIKKTKTQRDNSPVRSKMTELQEQWHRRKHRLDDFLLPVPQAVQPVPVFELPVVHVPVPTGIFHEEHVEQPIGSESSDFLGV